MRDLEKPGMTSRGNTAGVDAPLGGEQLVVRIESRDLFRNTREVEIVHEGRVYRLRMTQLNKLILTA